MKGKPKISSRGAVKSLKTEGEQLRKGEVRKILGPMKSGEERIINFPQLLQDEELPHILCMSCGRPLYKYYQRLNQEFRRGQTNMEKVLNDMSLFTYCCRLRFLTPIKTLNFSGRPDSSSLFTILDAHDENPLMLPHSLNPVSTTPLASVGGKQVPSESELKLEEPVNVIDDEEGTMDQIARLLDDIKSEGRGAMTVTTISNIMPERIRYRKDRKFDSSIIYNTSFRPYTKEGRALGTKESRRPYLEPEALSKEIKERIIGLNDTGIGIYMMKEMLDLIPAEEPLEEPEEVIGKELANIMFSYEEPKKSMLYSKELMRREDYLSKVKESTLGKTFDINLFPESGQGEFRKYITGSD